MRYASYQQGAERGVAEVRGSVLMPLVGVTEIDAHVSPSLLAAAPRRADAPVAVSAVDLLPVVPNPSKVICVGLNYLTHVEETHRDLPDYPVLFSKYASSLISATDDILLPPESAQVDFEAELAVVIGVGGRRIAESDALDHVLGYSVANDVTVRDYQYKTHQWLQGKAWDSSTPVGPYLVTPDEVDLGSAGIRTVLNGTTMQDSDLSRLIFPVARLIATISEFAALAPGDVILTGTPGGVGFRRDPQVFLRDGDIITVEVDGVGSLTSRVRQT